MRILLIEMVAPRVADWSSFWDEEHRPPDLHNDSTLQAGPEQSTPDVGGTTKAVCTLRDPGMQDSRNLATQRNT